MNERTELPFPTEDERGDHREPDARLAREDRDADDALHHSLRVPSYLTRTGPSSPEGEPAEPGLVTRSRYVGEDDAELHVRSGSAGGETDEAWLDARLAELGQSVVARRTLETERGPQPDVLTRGEVDGRPTVSRWTAWRASEGTMLSVEVRHREEDYPTRAWPTFVAVSSFGRVDDADASIDAPGARPPSAGVPSAEVPSAEVPSAEVPSGGVPIAGVPSTGAPAGTPTGASPSAGDVGIGSTSEPLRRADGDAPTAWDDRTESTDRHAPVGGDAAAELRAVFLEDGADSLTWEVTGATVESALNRPYAIELELLSREPGAEAAELFARSVALRIEHGRGTVTRSGIASSVRSSWQGHEGIGARVRIEPALAALGHGRDSRIFQDETVPEILEHVLGEGLGPYGRGVRMELHRDYPQREYTVQYQESDLDFAHRLMEEEGILYYFAQEDDVEQVVLIDDPAQHPHIDSATLTWSDRESDGTTLERDYVRALEQHARIRGTDVSTRHFDWTHPSLLVEGSDEAGDGIARESYEHDEQLTLHGFTRAYEASDVADQARIRADALRREQRVFEGRSTSAEIRPGYRFTLESHPEGLDGDYVVVEARHHVLDHARHGDTAGEGYVNVFTAVAASTPWRPLRRRARPRISGIQTAIVTGPAGEEIHCDDHGRIKVQFHWDRHGRLDERTSCWVRVMQTSAGSGFGAWVLPRVGWEVVVSFVDGDPDRPLVTGCVYNGDQPLPYPLPEKKSLTLFKSNSYPGGGGFNELRLDDSKNAEEIFLHGQKDWNTTILNDLTRDVGHDETQHVANNRTRTVGVDETLTVSNNRQRTVGVDETIQVGANRTRSVGANEQVMVGADRSHTVGANETIQVGADQAIQIAGVREAMVGADESLEVAGARSVGVAGAQSVQVGLDESYKIGLSAERKVGSSSNEKVGKIRKRKVGLLEMVNVGVGQMINVAAARIVSAGMVHMLNAGVMLSMKAGSKVQLSCGGSKVTLSPGGIKVEGPAIEIAAGGDVKVTGSTIHLN